mgnify:CR=1 FL=1
MTLERAILILQTMAGDWMETIMPEYLDEFCDMNGFDKEELTTVFKTDEWMIEII